LVKSKTLCLNPANSPPSCLPAVAVSEGGFIDIVGYTALMGDDEGKAFELLTLNNYRFFSLVDTREQHHQKKDNCNCSA